MAGNLNDAATIGQALEGRQRGDTWHCRCPVHNGSKRNFYVTQGRDRVLLYCFAGCSFEELSYELKARGLWHTKRSEPAETVISKDALEYAHLFCLAFEGAHRKGEGIATSGDTAKYKRYRKLLKVNAERCRQYGWQLNAGA